MSLYYTNTCNTSVLDEAAKIKNAKTVTIVTFSPKTSHYPAFELLHFGNRL